MVRHSTLPVLFSFHAQWANSIIATLDEIVEVTAGRLQIVQVDVIASPSLAERFKVWIIPNLLLSLP